MNPPRLPAAGLLTFGIMSAVSSPAADSAYGGEVELASPSSRAVLR